jgi:hypothetical protein
MLLRPVAFVYPVLNRLILGRTYPTPVPLPDPSPRETLLYLPTSVVVRHRFDADPDPTFHVDAHPGSDPYLSLIFTKSGFFFLTSSSHWFFFPISIIGGIYFSILDSKLKFVGTEQFILTYG